MTSQAEAEPDTSLPIPRRIFAVAAISAGSVLYTLDGGIPNVALPIIAGKLGITDASAVLLVSVYNLVLAMTLLPTAALGERIGHRRIFVAGLALYLIASIGCLFASGLPVLLVFRSLQALAAAGLLSVSVAMVRMVYPPSMLGRGLGINTMAATLGAAVAAPLGGLILAHAPWQAVFAAGIPLALIGFAFSRALPDSEPRTGAFDTKGAALCALTFGLLIVSIQALSMGAPAVLVITGLVAGFGSALLLIREERRAALPVLPVDLLAQPTLALSVAAALLAVLASTIIMIDLPFRLHMMGFGSAQIGAMIAPYAVTTMIAAPASGMLSDRIPAKILGTIGMVIATIGIASLIWMPPLPGFFDVAWRVVLCGLGFSMFFSPNGRLVVGSVPRSRAAGASSLVSTTRMFGQALGASAAAGLLAINFSNAAPLILSALLALAGFVCSAARIMVRQTDTT